MLRLTIVIALLAIFLSPLSAADTSWKLAPDQSGDWSDSTNWDSGEPTTSINAIIANAGIATIGQSGEICKNLYLGELDSGTVQIVGGGLTAALEYIGDLGAGTCTQTGGTNTISSYLYLGNTSTGSGTYNLSGTGSLTATNGEYIGYSGSGTFTQSGGANKVSAGTNGLNIGCNPSGKGSYSLSGGGSLTAPYEYVGDYGTGTFTQSGGTNTVGYHLYLGKNSTGKGTYELSDSGSLRINNSAYVGYAGSGTFRQTGGTNNIGSVSNHVVVSPSCLFMGCQSTANGTYSLSGNGSLYVTNSEYIGCSGSGTFTHTSGTNTTGFYLYLGSDVGGTGTYELSGTGSLSSGQEYIGYSGTGIFNQSAGTNTIPPFYYYLYLGYNATGNGTYNLSGTGYLSAAYECIGNSGAGTFTQTGGNNAINIALYLGYNSTGNGTYNLNGGVLTLKSLSAGSGTAAFNFGGGTLRASDVLNCSLPMTLTGDGGNANVDTAGYSMTLSGQLSGLGGLNKLGTGTLTLSGDNTYSGNTSVSRGTLALGTAGSLILSVEQSKSNIVFVGSGAILDLHGTLMLDLSDVTSPSQSWTLISNGGTTIYEPSFALTTKEGALFNQANDVWTYIAGSRQWTFTEATGMLSLSAVPEPSILVLLGIGAISLLGYVWRRQRS